MDTEQIKVAQKHLIRLGLLDPPVDGSWGKFSDRALSDFKAQCGVKEPDINALVIKALEISQPDLKLGNDFASRIVKFMLQNGYFVAIGSKRYNIIYVEGANSDGTPNADKPNQWNDRRIVVEIVGGIPKIVGNWLATSEPGRNYTINPMNPGGAARIAFGQYKAWQVGMHGTSDRHEALVQVRPIKVHRDLNKDFMRTGDKIDEGLFGVNQHWGYDMAEVNNASAGCLVGQKRNEHRDFMRIVKQDIRYTLNSAYIFFTAIIPGDKLAAVN